MRFLFLSCITLTYLAVRQAAGFVVYAPYSERATTLFRKNTRVISSHNGHNTKLSAYRDFAGPSFSGHPDSQTSSHERMVRASDVEYEGPDLYGQYHPIETPELLTRKLAAFDRAVGALPSHKTTNVLRAQRTCPELLTDDFKLIFLRCEVFNVPLAAKRYATYWDQRVELFAGKAFQPLTLDNMGSERDRVAREMGVFHLFEANGRIMAFEKLSRFSLEGTARESYVKTMWYLCHVALENLETQKRGMIVINYPEGVNIRKQKDLKFVRMAAALQGSLPMRLSAWHVCHPPPWVAVLFPIVKVLMPKHMQNRILMHSGSRQDVVKLLEGKYGLMKEDLPVEVGGLNRIEMPKFFQKRQAAGL